MAPLHRAGREMTFSVAPFGERRYPKVADVAALQLGIRKCVSRCQGICLKKKRRRVASTLLTGSVVSFLLCVLSLLDGTTSDFTHGVVAAKVKETHADKKERRVDRLNNVVNSLLSFEKQSNFTVHRGAGTSSFSSSTEGANDKAHPIKESPFTFLHSLFLSLHSFSRLLISPKNMYDAYARHIDATSLRSFSIACTPTAQVTRGLQREDKVEDFMLDTVRPAHGRKANSRGFLAATLSWLHHILYVFSRAFKNKVIPFFTMLFGAIWPTKPTFPPCETELLQEYDFVVIGSGAGGAVLAGRLSSLLKSKEEMEREAAAAARAEHDLRDGTSSRSGGSGHGNNRVLAGRAASSREGDTLTEEEERGGRQRMGSPGVPRNDGGTSSRSTAKTADKVKKHPTVLIVEAGGLPDLRFFSSHVVPLRAAENQQSDIDWSYQTVPQKHACKALKHASSRWPRGKVGGGSTLLTYMLFVRGHPSDYDSWASCIGDPSWKYENVEKYFKRAERVQFRSNSQNRKRRGKKGPVPVWRRSSGGNEEEIGVAAFLHAAVAAGYPWREDFNAAAGPEGAAQMQYNIERGRRVTPFQAYLYTGELKEKRDLLHALFHVRAIKILFHKETKRATAVQLVEENSCDPEKWKRNLCRVFQEGRSMLVNDIKRLRGRLPF